MLFDADKAELNADVLSLVPVGSAPHQIGFAYPREEHPNPPDIFTQNCPIVLEHKELKIPAGVTDVGAEVEPEILASKFPLGMGVIEEGERFVAFARLMAVGVPRLGLVSVGDDSVTPAIVEAVLPRATGVEPIVIEEFSRLLFGNIPILDADRGFCNVNPPKVGEGYD